jgi:hypothetical protein
MEPCKDSTAPFRGIVPKAIRAHFDGQHIVLDEPVELAKGTSLVVTVVSENSDVEGAEFIRRQITPEPRHRTPEPQPRRLFAVLMGVAYMLFVAQVLHEVTKWSYRAAFGVTVIGCLIVMAALALLGVKAHKNRVASNRFTFSTVFLVSIPLSVYLAALHLLLRDVPPESQSVVLWLFVAAFSMVGMIISTTILLSLAEALVWLAVASLRWLPNKLPRRRKA